MRPVLTLPATFAPLHNLQSSTPTFIQLQHTDTSYLQYLLPSDLIPRPGPQLTFHISCCHWIDW